MNPAWLDDMSWSMAEVYAAVTDRILINLAHFFPFVQPGAKIPGSWEYQARMLAQMGQVNRETVQIIAQSLGGADEALQEAIAGAIMEGLRDEEPKLRRAAQAGLLRTPASPQVQPGMMQAFQAYYRQSADKLNLVNTVMLESTGQAYAATVADVANRIQATQSILNTATGEVVTGVSTYNNAIRTAVNRMVENNLTGFIDHAGRHWSPEAYVAMDIRTTLANSARSAVWERNSEYGNDLYIVSTHQGARPLCYPWQGKIISTSGRTGETTDFYGNTYTIHSEDEIESFRYGGGLFGVNCGHNAQVWITGVSTIKKEPQPPEENAKTYAESQQQRALERKLREEKRDLEVMKAQGASPEQIKAQRQRVRDASAEIDDFCEQTGRTRRRDREGAPVRATWPGGTGEVTRYNGGYIGTDVVPPEKRIPRAATVTPPAPPVSWGLPFEAHGDPALQAYTARAQQLLEGAPDDVRAAWQRAQPDLLEPDYHATRGRAYYDTYDRQTHFATVGDAFNESSYQRADTVFFHEYGHNIDNALASDRWGFYSHEYQGGVFGRTIMQECEDRVREWYFHEHGFADAFDAIRERYNRPGEMGFEHFVRQALRSAMPRSEYMSILGTLVDAGDDETVLRPLFDRWLRRVGDAEVWRILHSPTVGRAFCAYVRRSYTMYERADVSDMFQKYAEARWGIDHPFDVGHKKGYFRSAENLPTEAFAEMFSATITQSDSLRVIREFFPRAYDIFLQMLRGAV